MTDTQTFTFWQFLKTYKIAIPKIQRDYAQGRQDKKTEIIRNSILDAISKALTEGGKVLNLDFVYGSLVGNANKITPLDGQQRLTTLFLIHWYLSAISDNLTEQNKNILLEFSYETRLSSGRFCRALIENTIEIPTGGDKKLSEEITDKSWFYFSWKKDPTVNAMLTMLDAIHERFYNKPDYWNILTSGSPITFQFLLLNKFNLTDELYVKMNARGIGLSDFENFKAWLDDQLTNGDFGKTKKEHWSDQLDTNWTDLFWENDNGDFSIDEEMMNFFKGMALFLFTSKGVDADQDDYSLFKAKQDFEPTITKLNDYSKYISNDEFNKILFSKKYLRLFDDMTSFLDLYSANEKKYKSLLNEVSFWNQGSENLFLHFIQRPTFAQRVLFFGLFYYVIQTKDVLNDNEFKTFFRVLRNLVENTTINASNFKNVLESVQRLSNANNLLTSLKENEIDLTGFDGEQIREESIKARLIIDENSEWENVIIEAENHLFFRGRVNFILAISNNMLQSFIGYYKILNLIFIEGGINFTENNLFQRALLAKGDYTLENYRLCRTDKEWKSFLNSRSEKINILKDLLDDIKFQNNDLKTSFDAIIENYLDDVENWDDCTWRYNLIKYPEIWTVSKYKYLRVRGNTVSLRRIERDSYGDNTPLNSSREIIISKLLAKKQFEVIMPVYEQDVLLHETRIIKIGNGDQINFYKNEWVGLRPIDNNGNKFFPVIYFNDDNYMELGIRKSMFDKTDKIIPLDLKLSDSIIADLEMKFIGDSNRSFQYLQDQSSLSDLKYSELDSFVDELFNKFLKLANSTI